jgi:hypothetical protein
MRGLCGPCGSFGLEGCHAFDLAHRPQGHREVKHRRGDGVVSEAKGQIVTTARLEQGDRALQMLSGFEVLSGEQTGRSRNPVRDTRFRRVGSRLDVA